MELKIPKLRQGSYVPEVLKATAHGREGAHGRHRGGLCAGHLSTRSVDGLVKALGMSGVSKSQAARLCVELDERVGAFRAAPTCVKTREAGRIVSVAV